MAINFSPELFVARLVKLSTNGRVISARFRRILTLVLTAIWIGSLFQIIMSLKDLNVEVVEHQKHRYITYHSLSRHLIESEPVEIIFYVVLFLLVPWFLLRIVYWVIDAEKS